MSDDFPVAFLYFVDDFECSQALQFIHDKEIDAYDFYQHGVNVIGFTSLAGFKECEEFSLNSQFRFISYAIQLLNM